LKRLPGKTAGQDCLARQLGKTTGQDCRARLPGKTAGQDLLVLYSMKQFENLPLQQGSHARMQFGNLPQQQGNARSLVVWRMQSCNGRQAVMSALEALVLAGKGLNAFSVLLLLHVCSSFTQAV
jgi:hypothetical protein